LSFQYVQVRIIQERHPWQYSPMAECLARFSYNADQHAGNVDL